MRYFVKTLAIFFILLKTVTAEIQPLSSFNQAADAFLKKYVEKGKVDYKSLKQNFSEVDKLYLQLAGINLTAASKNDKMAFYINAYNVIVIRQITEYFPLKSALDKNGFFDKVRHQVGGEELTLDQIEKGKVIIPFRDPRVHFAFSCAAIGCPELGDFAYTAENLQGMLEQRTRSAINNPEFIIVDPATKEVKLSMIFKWYEKDFMINEPSVLAYINKYSSTPIPDGYTVSYYKYNWDLNIQ
jgi:hypothetical protein